MNKFQSALLITTLLFLTGCIGTEERFEFVHRPPGTTELVYTKDPVPLKLLAYPTGGESPAGAVIFIHGGGWAIGGADMPLFQDWIEPLNERRLMSFSVEHRTSPAYRGIDPLIDCLKAFRYVRDHAAEFGIPSDRIAMIGFSSGGHMAVMTGLTVTDPRLLGKKEKEVKLTWKDARAMKAIVSFYAPMEPWELYETGSPEMKKLLKNYLPVVQGETEEEKKKFIAESIRQISPSSNLHRYAPPMLLVHGHKDRLVPPIQSISFFWKTKRIGNRGSKLLLVERGDHNFNMSRNQWARDAEIQALDFIAERMK